MTRPNFFFVGALTLWLTRPVLAQEALSIQQLVSEAVRLTGYAQPEALPTIVYVSRDGMAALICRGRPNCPVFGVYLDADIIYLRDDLIADGQEHLLVHETVHWLQHHSGRYNLNSCEDTIAREQEAYRVENRYIAEVQHGFQFMAQPPMQCHPGL